MTQLVPKREVDFFSFSPWTAVYGGQKLSLNKKEKAIILIVSVVSLVFLVIGAAFAFFGTSYYLKHRKIDLMEKDNHSIAAFKFDKNSCDEFKSKGIYFTLDNEMVQCNIDKKVIESLPPGSYYIGNVPTGRFKEYYDLAHLNNWVKEQNSTPCAIIVLRYAKYPTNMSSEAQKDDIEGKKIPFSTLVYFNDIPINSEIQKFNLDAVQSLRKEMNQPL